MKNHLFGLCLIALLSLLIGYHDEPTDILAQENALDDSKLQFVSIENIGGSRDVTGLLETNITPPISNSGRNRDIVNENTSIISPDGERIIFGRHIPRDRMRLICVYIFSTNSSSCTDTGISSYIFDGGKWSPDGRYLALNDYFQFDDADILLYDTQENRLINRTEDNISSENNPLDEMTEDMRISVLMDVAPTWSPNGDLYFFRSAIDPTTNDWRTDLMRISFGEITGTSTPEVIFQHPSNQFAPVYLISNDMLDGPMSISPNGQYLAYSAYSWDEEDIHKGVWVIDLIQKSLITHLTYEQLGSITTGMPDSWAQSIGETGISQLPPRSLGWSSDSNRLVILLRNDDRNIPFIKPLIKYDISASTLETFYDYSGLPIFANRETPFDDISLSVENEMSNAVMSPTNRTVFYIGQDIANDAFVLSALSLVESGFTTPTRLGILESFQTYPIYVSTPTSIGYNGDVVRILAGGNLITLREE